MTLIATRVSSKPQIVPPFTGAEILYIIDANGVSSKVALSDLLGQGVRPGINNDAANFPQFALLALNGNREFVLAQNNVDLLHATVVAIAIAAIAIGQTGNVQFAGYVPGLSGLTPGPVWLGTGGGLLAAAPTASCTYQCKIGTAFSSTELFFNPQAPFGPQ